MGDGSLGVPDRAPFDAIAVAAAAPAIPPALYEQLVEGGRLVVPRGGRWGQQLVAVVRTEAGPSSDRASRAGSCRSSEPKGLGIPNLMGGMRNRRPGYRVTAVETSPCGREGRVFARPGARSSPAPRELGAAGQVLLRRGDRVHRQPRGCSGCSCSSSGSTTSRPPFARSSSPSPTTTCGTACGRSVTSAVTLPIRACASWWSPHSPWSRTSRSCTSSCEPGRRSSPPRRRHRARHADQLRRQ